ncbi:hypothetical protein M3Y99_01329200 [Aphelenchoides fujianensis]|nr:hypothetical protein M3Y99_01329200 [Aphelenchoides fujianensis]
MQTKWTAQMGDFWKAEGEIVVDRVHFHDNWTGGRDDTPQVFAVESAQLMVGKLVNYLYFNNFIGGYLGLAPGEHNLVVQAFNQGLIPAPMLSRLWIYGAQHMYFGGLPRGHDTRTAIDV